MLLLLLLLLRLLTFAPGSCGLTISWFALFNCLFIYYLLFFKFLVWLMPITSGDLGNILVSQLFPIGVISWLMCAAPAKIIPIQEQPPKWS